MDAAGKDDVEKPAGGSADKPAPGTPDLIRHHAALAQTARDAELAAEGIEVEEDKDPDKPVRDNGERERGEDGKFKPKSAEVAKAEPPKSEPTTKPAKEAPPIVAESLVALQKLVGEGKIADALKAIGLDEKGPTSKQWEAFRRDVAKADAKVGKAKQEAAGAYQQVERIAAGLEQQYGRYRAAEQAFKNEDYDEFFRLAAGMDLNTFQAKAISKLANRDPEVARLRAEMQQERAARAQLEQQQRQAWEAQQLENERAGYMTDLGKQLTEIDDPRIPRAAGRKDFVQRVFAVQAKHYDARSDSTISTQEAAELALAELEQEYTGLRSVFDGEGGAAKPARTSTGVKPGVKGSTRPVSPARQATNLKTQEAAEAHHEEPLRGKALIKKHVAMTLAALAREQNGVASE